MLEMRLHEEPFNLIKKGVKTVEYRLNDAKRKAINIGDTIIFYKRPEEKETLKVKITAKKYYSNLLDMYTDTFNLYLKDKYQSPNDAVKDTPYYSKEEISKYGCVAIFFEVIEA